MARTDSDAVVRDLTAWIATEKPGYGRAELLEKLAELNKTHEVPESLLERALRIFGPAFVRQSNPPETGPSGGGGSTPPDKEPDPGPTMSQEVHHGSRNGREAVGAQAV